jgi:hypothetical protein
MVPDPAGNWYFVEEVAAIFCIDDFHKMSDVEQNSNSLQQLKAEISAMISKWKHCCELGVDWYEVELSDYERLQKLSAV